MDKIISIDPISTVAVVEAGVVLKDLDTALRDHNLTVPLDLGPKDKCQIGGNLSTNAGGLRFLRYGSLHGSVVGIEVVRANGEVLDLMSTMRKDNSGLDLKQLFIGAEGSLGLITRAAIACAPLFPSRQVVMFRCPNFERTLDILQLARQRLGEILSAVEFLDAACLASVERHGIGVSPFQAGPPRSIYMVLETLGSDAQHDREKLDRFLATVGCEDARNGIEGVRAQSVEEAAAMWRCREGVAPALAADGAVFKFDISLPQRSMYDLVVMTEEWLRRGLGTYVFSFTFLYITFVVLSVLLTCSPVVLVQLVKIDLTVIKRVVWFLTTMRQSRHTHHTEQTAHGAGHTHPCFFLKGRHEFLHRRKIKVQRLGLALELLIKCFHIRGHE